MKKKYDEKLDVIANQFTNLLANIDASSMNDKSMAKTNGVILASVLQELKKIRTVLEMVTKFDEDEYWIEPPKRLDPSQVIVKKEELKTV